MPACVNETVAPLWPTPSRARAGSSSSSSSEAGSPRPGSPIADWSSCSEPRGVLSRVLGWYPALLLRLARQMISVVLLLAWSQVFLSAGLWMLDLALHLPLTAAKWFLSALYGSRGQGRTVIVTGGSVEALQLARNFYQAGARVIMLEHADRFGLARFSTAVHRYYTVPSPQQYPQEYVREVCRIAERENASYFVPSSTSHPAHFDALAKPHLEQLGVTCICAGVKEAWLMDDPSSMLQLCHDANLPTPLHFRVTAPEQLTALYEDGQLRRARHVLMNAGPVSARENPTILELPQTRRGFRRLVQSQPKILMVLSASRPALVLQTPEGERLLTCTTVREGKVVCNVTVGAPLPGEDTPVLQPVQREDVDHWLEQLFAALPPSRVFSGHLSFTLVATRTGIVPLSCRLGVSLAYLCLTSAHPRLLMRPCRHHIQTHSDPSTLVLEGGRYWLHEAVLKALKSPGFGSTYRLICTLTQRHEALFTAWDPLPCGVYYGLQVPSRALLRLINGAPKVILHRPTPYHAVHFTENDHHSRSSNGHVVTNGVIKNGHSTSLLKHVHSFSPIPEDSAPLKHSVSEVKRNSGCNGVSSHLHHSNNGHVLRVHKGGLENGHHSLHNGHLIHTSAVVSL